MSDKKEGNPKDFAASHKVPLWLLPAVAKAHWAMAQLAGALKYGAWNWRETGVRSSVYLSAMQRHLDAYTSGEEFDPVDNTHHLGNIMACCSIILDAANSGVLNDDRPTESDIRECYAACEKISKHLTEKYGKKDV